MRRSRFVTLLLAAAFTTISCPGDQPSESACRGWTRVSVPKGFPELLASGFARDANDVWLTGSAGTPLHAVIVHWDGSSWKVLSTPSLSTRGSHLGAIGGVAADDLWTVGVID